MNELQQPHEIDNIRSTFSDLRSNKLKESSPIFRTYLLNEIDLLKILTIAVGKIGPPKENSLAEGAESQNLPSCVHLVRYPVHVPAQYGST